MAKSYPELPGRVHLYRRANDSLWGYNAALTLCGETLVGPGYAASDFRSARRSAQALANTLGWPVIMSDDCDEEGQE